MRNMRKEKKTIGKDEVHVLKDRLFSSERVISKTLLPISVTFHFPFK
jgi:hypothetical protein